VQPVDVREVAGVVADTVEAEPSYDTTQFAGPEIVSLGELAREWRAARGRRAVVLPVPARALGERGRALDGGALTHPGAWRGRTAFATWLRDGSQPVAVAAGSPA
jgi:uncharacterized protein YbjT (DUF2867 family)